jgi:hypothetical protein
MDSIERQCVKRSNQRLKRQEPYGCGNVLEITDATENASALHAYTHPDVVRPKKLRREVSETLATLGEHLEGMVCTVTHCREYVLDVSERNVLVEKIAHGVHKHHSRLTPAAR